MISIDKETNKISLTRGDSATFLVELVDDKDEPYTPQDGDVIRFAMDKRFGVEEPLLVKYVDTETMSIYIQPEDTKHLDFGTYVYDIELTDQTGSVTTVLLGKIKLTKEVF